MIHGKATSALRRMHIYPATTSQEQIVQSRYSSCHNQQMLTARREHVARMSHITSYRRFSRKLQRRTYSFSWLFFDKIKSQKRCKGMLNCTQQRLVRNSWRYHLPWSMIRKNSFDVLIMPVWGSDIVCIRAWCGAFQPLIWAISHAETVLIAGRENNYWL